MARGYLTTKEIKRRKWMKENLFTVNGNFTGTEAQKKEYDDLESRWNRQKRNRQKQIEAKEKAEAEKKEQAKKDSDPFTGKRQTNLSKDHYKGEKGGIDVNTGGGQPISKGKTWPDEPEKERVEQPRDDHGQFTFNSLIGKDKKDKRDRAKGTGDFGDDPALVDTETRKKDNAIGQEYVNRKSNGAGGFKKGEVFKLKDGSTVVFTHDISLKDFYKYYMTNYRDDAGEIRNALYENGLLVRIGQKYGGGKDTGKVADISGSESSLGSKKRYKEFEAASQRWTNFVKDKAAQAEISKKEEFANTIGKFAVKHPGEDSRETKGEGWKSEKFKSWISEHPYEAYRRKYITFDEYMKLSPEEKTAVPSFAKDATPTSAPVKEDAPAQEPAKTYASEEDKSLGEDIEYMSPEEFAAAHYKELAEYAEGLKKMMPDDADKINEAIVYRLLKNRKLPSLSEFRESLR